MLKVSSKLKVAGLIAAIIVVLLLPPSAFYNILVNLLSLYGTIPPFYLFAKAVITLPKVERDLLIFDPSANLAPVAPVFEALSDPAKSTKFISETFLLSGFPVYLS